MQIIWTFFLVVELNPDTENKCEAELILRNTFVSTIQVKDSPATAEVLYSPYPNLKPLLPP